MFTGLILAAALMSVACTHTVKVEPIEVKPITLNINIKIDRELDNFFDYEKAAATQPAAQGDHP
ncbi:MAG: hypothetical protein K8S99_15670 [Planctomycetes bacterium]|nr:hypothetical protein [Planctomycetota bacterium]